MSTPDSTYAKPFLTIPEQIQRLRTRGMDCGTETFAAGVLERYGYYRLSGYWHLYRARPEPPADRFDKDGREIRLDSFMPETSLAHVVALYEFDHELRTRLRARANRKTGPESQGPSARVCSMSASSCSAACAAVTRTSR